MFKGVAASPGVEIGKAYLVKKQQLVINKGHIAENKVIEEKKRLEEAIDKSKAQVKEIKEETESKLGSDKAEIFGAHELVLEDQVYLNEIKEMIEKYKITAENAVYQVTENYIREYKNVEDEYLKQRADDIKDVGERIIRNILGISSENLGDINEEVIIVAEDLTPSSTAQINKDKILAFATDMGGRTSHTAIMARSLGIPAVVGLSSIYDKVKDGDTVIVDGNKGIVYVNPDEATLKEYKKIKEDYIRYQQELKKLKDLPGETRDKTKRVNLSANIGTPEDIKGALENGAEGIGLYRTEFLFMGRESMPTEEEQFEKYKAVAEVMAPRPIIIRSRVSPKLKNKTALHEAHQHISYH